MATARANRVWMELLLDVKSRGLVDRSQAGHRRRRLGILEGPAEGLPDHPHAALLGPQDGQRPRQAAQAIAARAKEAIHDIWMADTREAANRRSTSSWRPTARSTRRPASAWPRTVTELLDLLRLPGRALESLADDQPHRERRSPRSACGTAAPRAAAHAPPAWPWSTN